MESTITPLNYIETHKKLIALNLKENPLVTWGVDEVISFLKDIISNLGPIRSDEVATRNYLSSLLRTNSGQKQVDIPISNLPFIENWLFKSLDQDDTFVYAFNFICNRYNMELGFIIPLKNEEECIKKLSAKVRQKKTKEAMEEQKKLRIPITKESKLAFTNLFRDPTNAAKILKRLKDNNFVGKDEVWIGLSGRLSELLAGYEVISKSPKKLLKPGSKLTQVKSFYERFGLPYGKNQYLSIGTLRIDPSPSDLDEFKRMLSDII